MGYALKRKLSVYGIIFLILAIAAFWFYNAKIKERPTCFDKIKNGVEEGIDCGGICEEICTFKAEKVNIHWTRAFEVVPGIFNIAASIENPNFNYSFKMDYTIKYINERGLNVGEINNTVFLEPLEKEIIFYPGIKLKGQKIARVFLVQDRVYDLEKSKQKDNKLTINSKELIREKGLTKLKVIVQNDDFIPQRSIQVSSVLFDKNGNAMEVNRTYIDYLDKNERKPVYMTWPKEFEDKVAEIKVYLNKSEI